MKWAGHRWILWAWAWGGTLAAVAAGDPAAEELLDRVRQSLPEVPLEMQAQVRVLDPHGRVRKSLQTAAWLAPVEEGRRVRYILYDAFGRQQQQMDILLAGDRREFSFFLGDPPRPAPTPDLFAPIEESEICWMDLSFSFLWWPHPKIVGAEKVANRWNCQIVELTRPAGESGGWSHVRLWVAPAYNAVVRGEAWQDGRPIRRFEVQSVRKLRRVYMIGDMEVTRLDTGARARLKVYRMRMLSPEYTDEEREEFEAPVEW